VRRELEVVIDDGTKETNRDFGKRFLIIEMPADKAEKWAMRALLAVAHSGVDIGEVANAGMAGIAILGLQALANLDFEIIEPLMDEMFGCIKIKEDPMHPSMSRLLTSDDIEEVTTRLRLRAEVFSLHTGFSQAGVKSTPISASATPHQPVLSPPRMSRQTSTSSSPHVRPR
jgi:hypothetical protein